jgi:hypothetical protein
VSTRLAQDETLDAATYKWFVQQQYCGVPLSSPIISAQAEKIDRQITGDSSEFKTIASWPWRVCMCHGISQVSISGEMQSANHTAASSYPSQLTQLSEAGGFTPEQLYNDNDTGVLLPQKVVADKSQEHNTKGSKAIKERITVVCCKTVSHKVKTLCIGKSRNPAVFIALIRGLFRLSTQAQRMHR